MLAAVALIACRRQGTLMSGVRDADDSRGGRSSGRRERVQHNRQVGRSGQDRDGTARGLKTLSPPSTDLGLDGGDVEDVVRVGALAGQRQVRCDAEALGFDPKAKL